MVKRRIFFSIPPLIALFSASVVAFALPASANVSAQAASAAPAHVLAGHQSAPASKIRPFNAPCTCNNAIAVPQANTSQNTWLNQGILYVNGQNFTQFQLNSSNELVIKNGPYIGECLYYDKDAVQFDAKACDSTKLSDQWGFGDRSHTYSLWYSLYNTNECVWFNGAGQQLVPAPCDGNNSKDRWNWFSIF